MFTDLLEAIEAAAPLHGSAAGLRIGFPMHLLDEPTPHCLHADRDRDHKLSLTDRKAPFLLLYQTLTKLGHRPGVYAPGEADLSIYWTGKHVPDSERERAIIMEVAWLPRWHYQISPTGSNYLGHYAQAYRFAPLSHGHERDIRTHLTTMRALFERHVNADNVRRLTGELPPEFVLFPLQLANDFNLKFSGTDFARFYSPTVDNGVALAQACIDKAAGVARTIPVVFRQHPFDPIQGFRDRLQSDQWLIDNSDQVSCHDIFATGRCRGVISVNSNTVHEAAVWNIPSICLGNLVWSKETAVPPFAASLDELDAVLRSRPQDDPKLLAYLHYLVRQQWTLADFQNPLMVDALLASRGLCEPMALRRAVGLAA